MKRIINSWLAALLAMFMCFSPSISMAGTEEVTDDEPLITVSDQIINYGSFGQPEVIDPEITVGEAVYGKKIKVEISFSGSGNLNIYNFDDPDHPEGEYIGWSLSEKEPQLIIEGKTNSSKWTNVLSNVAFLLVEEEYEPNAGENRVFTYEASIWIGDEIEGNWGDPIVQGTKTINIVLKSDDEDEEEQEQEQPFPPVDEEDDEQEPQIPPVENDPPIEEPQPPVEEEEPPVVENNPPVQQPEQTPVQQPQPPDEPQQAPKGGIGENLPAPKVQEKLALFGVTDIQANHYAAGSISVLIEAGLITPDANGNVNPDAQLSAGDGVAIFAKVLGIASRTDTPEQALAKAQQAGIARQGLAAGTSLRRSEVAQLLGTALGVTPKVVNGPDDYPFADYSTTDPQVRGMLAALYELGVFKGYEDKSFRPDGVLTRAEIAILIDRILSGAQ